jgi:asparagine synthase (glutamine-hydrolysing)
MCGVVCFWGEFDDSLVEEMTRMLTHRGPDDSGTWFNQEKGIGLGHRRLSIIDLSQLGRQPMFDVTGTAVIVDDGEIYNYRELRSDLEKDGFHCKSRSDTEVLLDLFFDTTQGCSPN